MAIIMLRGLQKTGEIHWLYCRRVHVEENKRKHWTEYESRGLLQK